MKKYEKVLLGIFVIGIIAFIADFLIEVCAAGTELDYHFFGGITKLLSALFMISVFGLMALLVSVRLRKRAEAGEPPISRLYKISFILSFVPFLAMAVYFAAQDEFIFMGETVAVGARAFLDHMIIGGVVVFSIIVPVFPVIIFWQLLYIVKRIQYRNLMK
ncbi:hypothetical protein [Ruminococcus sp.]